MNYPRTIKHQLDESIDDLVFQIISWNSLDYEYDTDSDNNDDGNFSKYLIKIFGVTEKGKSVSVNILNYTPYFYIKIHHKIEKYTAQKLQEFIVNKLPYNLKNSLLDVTILKKKDFVGFSNNEKFTFARFKFKNIGAYRASIRLFQKKVEISSISKELIKYKLYESNIDPFIRMMHIRNIEPCGWIKLEKGKYNINSCNLLTHCQIDVECKWTSITKCDKEQIAPIIIASFDLECTSSHGDFPVPKKSYSKIAYELLQYFNTHKNNQDSNIKEIMYHEIIKIFQKDIIGIFSKVYTKVIPKLDELEKKLKRTMDDIIATLYNKINYKEKETDGKIASSKDMILEKLIEILGYYKDNPEDKKHKNSGEWIGIFPELEGDEIIQIGTTIHAYGDSECSYKNIITLGTCELIDGVEVQTCITEKELLLKWRDLIIKLDPDIMTGYNILGFDMSYLYERAKQLGITKEFCKIGRFRDHSSEYEEKELSSSALGDNLLKYINMEGRVIIDIMKVVQRDHKLDSYKLDAVASHFMKMNKNDVHPSDIFRLQKGTAEDRKIIADYCFTEGTRVSLSSCSVDIKCLENMNTDVVTWVENKGFSTSKKMHFFNNGKKDCIKLTLIDGTQICCTSNHQFLTKNGWIEAQNLQSTDKILYYPEPAFTDYDTEKLYTFKFSELIGTLDYNKSCIFLRLLGYLLTDSGISESTCYKNYSSGRIKYIYDVAYINLGTKIDAINMQKDILTLIGKLPVIIKQKYTYRMTMPQKLTKWFLSIDSVEKGKRLSSTINLPNFIVNENCEKWILREFLKGLMGGDGYCPTFNKGSNKFNNVAFSQSKTYDNIESLRNYMKNIQKILEKFNINSTLLNVTKNAKGEGYTIKINIKQDDIIIFYEKIGYAYCIGKSYKLAIASSYYKLKRETKRQFNWICERVKILKKNMLISEALKQAHSELEINEPIFNKHYSLPSIESINLNLYNPNDISASSCKFKKLHFPSVEEYLKLTESYDRFVTNDNTKSYSVKKDDTHSPCYYLSILSKKNIGKQTVYDIEVKDTHNFVANGAVVHNCVQDCALCNHLMMKLEIIANNIGMSNVCYVPLAYIFFRGQGIKIFSLVAKECREDDFVIPTLNYYEDTTQQEEDGFEGAIVLSPKAGIYINDPIAVLDYASLYPSSMISENLSHDSIVLNEKYNNLPGYEYIDITYDVFEKINDKKIKTSEKTIRFAQFPNGEKGTIPKILMKLLRQRKETRKKIEFKTVTTKTHEEYKGIMKEKDDIIIITKLDGSYTEIYRNDIETIENTYNNFQKAVLDGLQSAYKVTANSLYGQCGAKTSAIFMKEIAACTTAIGRKMILKAKKFLEENYFAEIIYGDSVTGYTPIIIKHNNLVNIETIENIAYKYGDNNWQKCIEIGKQDKESCEIENIDTWSDIGWTKIHRIIRHELVDTKKIIRVNTYSGIVDVTDDHSLLKYDKTIISPYQLNIGDSLLHSPYPKLYNNCNIHSINEARIMGFFYRNGYCGKYNYPWGLNNSDMKLQEKYLNLCKLTYPELQWNILELSGIYKIFPHLGPKYSDIVQKYREIMYYGEEKTIPITILNASFEIRESFWKGLYDECIYSTCCFSNQKEKKEKKEKVEIISRINRNQISIAMLNLLGDSLGYNTSLHTYDKKNMITLNLNKNIQCKNPDKIKNMYEIPYSGYVYDLTTENHHFQAGIGKLIVHNTDSLFVAFPNKDETGKYLHGKQAIMPSIKTAMEASKEFNKLLKAPHDLEYEKTFWPFILFSKKRYAANKYVFDDEHYIQNSMGIVLRRRDNANIVKQVFGGILDIILNENDINKSLQFLKDILNQLIDGKIPIEDLIVTKNLKGNYKDPERIAHKVLADRMKSRDPGTAPNTNDRIPYAYIQVKEKKGQILLQGNRIEHPDYIKKNNLKLDYEFYITNQILKPILQLYALILEDLEGYRKGKNYFKEMYPRLLKDKDYDEKKAKDRWNDLREIEVKALLFDPILIKIKNKRLGNREITDFFKIQLS